VEKKSVQKQNFVTNHDTDEIWKKELAYAIYLLMRAIQQYFIEIMKNG
jgi:hypothetical protein